MLFPGQTGNPGFGANIGFFDASTKVHLRSSSCSVHDAIYPRLLTMTFTTVTLRSKQLMAV
jgi:hypothetical protein